MNKKKITGIIIAGVVVVACAVGGVYTHMKNKPSEDSNFTNLINTQYSVNVQTTKSDNGYNYELNVEGDKLTSQDVENIAKQAKAVAKNVDEIVVNQFKNGSKVDNFNGFISPDLVSKAIIDKDGTGTMIKFNQVKNEKYEKVTKVSQVSNYSTNGTSKLDGTEMLNITLSDDKDMNSQGNAIFRAIEKANSTNDKMKSLVVRFNNSDNTKGVIIDNSNPNVEADYSTFNA